MPEKFAADRVLAEIKAHIINCKFESDNKTMQKAWFKKLDSLKEKFAEKVAIYNEARGR